MTTAKDEEQVQPPRLSIATEVCLGWAITPDGSAGQLRFLTENGEEVDLTIPAAALQRATLTLLELAAESLRRQKPDHVGFVHPVAGWRVSPIANLDQRLLTLSTPEGLTLSFVIARSELEAISTAARRPEPLPRDVIH